MSKGMSLITFDTMAVEDRSITNATGHIGYKDIDIVKITPVGGHLTVEQEVTPDLLKQWKFNPDMEYRFKAYEAWKDGKEPPVNGFSLKMWPPISPAQIKQFSGRNIRSVEELAELPDDALTSFGPGSRLLRDKAREWLKTSSETGKIVEQLMQLKTDNDELKLNNEKNAVLIEQMSQELKELKGKKKTA